jgi:hypothetical protein
MQGFRFDRAIGITALMTDEPRMTPKAGGFFSEWSVEIVWPSGHKDKVTGFRDEAHAKGWIAHESKAWIAKMRAPRRV